MHVQIRNTLYPSQSAINLKEFVNKPKHFKKGIYKFQDLWHLKKELINLKTYSTVNLIFNAFLIVKVNWFIKFRIRACCASCFFICNAESQAGQGMLRVAANCKRPKRGLAPKIYIDLFANLYTILSILYLK